MIRSLTRPGAPNRLRMLPALLAVAAAAAVLAACSSSAPSSTGGSSSGSSPAATTGGSLKTATFATLTRSDGSVQCVFDGHPLYTFVGDTAPGQAKGNGLTAFGGVWHEATTSGTVPAGSSSSGSGGGGGGY